ncbi:MAG: sigma-54 interaction domain-containing protein [Planctomycetota bacterium JB042]
MSSESEVSPEEKTRLFVAAEDDEVRRRLSSLLDRSPVDVIEPDGDPLDPDQSADLVVLHRSEVRAEDLRLVDSLREHDSAPDVVVLHDDAEDRHADRARLRAAGASDVLDTGESNDVLREKLEALATASHDARTPSPAPKHGDADPRLSDFYSRNEEMRRFLDFVQRVVDTDSSLLITGETGVGKERLAQAIHNDGPRAAAPFVAVNCGAIPESLLESELFGHEAGAFTGAERRRKGRFETAHGGTIFLDEIGEMPLHLQVNLLTVLQRRRVQRVGGEESIPIDVRVMAATNRDLLAEIEAGRFRQDLFYRLHVVGLRVPPLRERREDIADLAGDFIRIFRESLGRRYVERISDEALDALLSWSWPGNVRELVNAIEHALVVCRSDRITRADLPDSISAGCRPPAPPSPASASPASDGREEWLDLPLAEARRRATAAFERAYLTSRLEQTGGRVGEAAKLAGISPRALYDRMKKHGLRKEAYR